MSPREEESRGVQLVGSLCLAGAGVVLLLLGLTRSDASGFWSVVQVVVGLVVLVLGGIRTARLLR